MLNLKQYFAIEKNKALMIIKAVMLALTLSAFLANVFCAFEYNKALLTVTAYVALASLLASLFYCRKNWYAVIMLAVMTVTVYSAWVDCMWFFVYPFEQSVASTSASMRMMCAYALFSFAVLCFINKEFENTQAAISLVETNIAKSVGTIQEAIVDNTNLRKLKQTYEQLLLFKSSKKRITEVNNSYFECKTINYDSKKLMEKLKEIDKEIQRTDFEISKLNSIEFEI